MWSIATCERDRVGRTLMALCARSFYGISREAGEEVDASQWWVDFACEPSDPVRQSAAKSFLHMYVESSWQERVVLGPEERAPVRTVNSAQSLIEVWRRLVAAADWKVLRLKRRELRACEKHSEAARLVLKWEQKGDKREGPAYTIATVSRTPYGAIPPCLHPWRPLP